MKKVLLADFVNFFEAQKSAAFTNGTITKYLCNHEVDMDEFASFVYFREDTYGRNFVCGNDLYEMLVLTWLPGQYTPIHDHAGQRCWMRMLAGSLEFKNYYPIDRKNPELIEKGKPERHETGGGIYIDDSMGVHSIKNSSSKPAISLHVYSSPIQRCQIYNEAKKKFEWLDLNYFTPPSAIEPPMLSK